MKVELVDIPIIPSEWQTVHDVKALAVNGEAQALDALLAWSKSSRDDFKKIMKVIRLVAGNDRIRNPRHVKKDQKSEIYEMRADQGNARLFFFYSPDEDKVVICTNAYWKAKASSEEQERAFQRARDLKEVYDRALRSR